MTKKELTKLIIADLETPVEFKIAYIKWWYKDIRDTNFRLRPDGYKFFKTRTPLYKFEIKMWATPKTFKSLSYLNCPYYISHKSHYNRQITEIILFSDKVAMTAKLYLDFDTYLHTLT